MTDEPELDDDCTYADDGECDDEYCEHRGEFYVEMECTVKFTVRAHDDEEATTIVDNLGMMFNVSDPSEHDGRIEDFTMDEEYTLQSEAEAIAEQRKWAEIRAQVASALAEDET